MDLAKLLTVLGFGSVAWACTCKDVSGRMYDEKNNCMRKMETAGCTDLQDCDDAVTSARDDEGDIWVFNNNCIPKGWNQVRFDDSDIEACE